MQVFAENGSTTTPVPLPEAHVSREHAQLLSVELWKGLRLWGSFLPIAL